MPLLARSDFYGVSCSSTGELTEIILTSNKLTGSMPASLGALNLSFLCANDAACCGASVLTRARPPCPCSFLNANLITGTLPPEWGSLTNLQSL